MRRSVSLSLIVHEARQEDIYRDIARIHEDDRDKKKIPSGTICKVAVNGRKRFLIVRGNPRHGPGTIDLDDYNRERLGDLLCDSSASFQVRPTYLPERIWWACTLTDPAPRIAMQIAIVSLILGVALPILPFLYALARAIVCP